MNKQFNLVLLSFILLNLAFCQTNISKITCDSSINSLLQTADNPNGPKSQNSSKTVTGLQYCKNLNNKQSCCSSGDINALKDQTKNFIKSLNKKNKELDTKQIQFMKTSSLIQKQSTNYDQQMSSLVNTTSNTTRILQKIYGRQLQTDGQKPTGQNKTGEQKPTGDQKQTGGQKPTDDQKQTGGQKPTGDQKQTGGQKPTGDQKQTGGQKPTGDQKQTGGQKPTEKGPQKPNGTQNRPLNGKKPNGTQNRPLNGQKPNGTQNKPLNGQKPNGAQDKRLPKKMNEKTKQFTKEQMNKYLPKQKDQKQQKPKMQRDLSNIQSKIGANSPKELKKLIIQSQSERATCIRYLFKIQTKFACMGCDSNQIQSALNKGGLELSTKMCTQIQQNCFKFANLNQNISMMQNNKPLMQQSQNLQDQRLNLQNANDAIKKLNEQISNNETFNANKTQEQITKYMQDLNSAQNKQVQVDTTFYASQLPANCTSTNCTYLCDNLIRIDLGGINFDFAQNPGLNVSINISNQTDIQQFGSKNKERQALPQRGQRPPQNGQKPQKPSQNGQKPQKPSQNGQKPQIPQSGQKPPQNNTQPQNSTKPQNNTKPQNSTKPQKPSTSNKRLLASSLTSSFSSTGVEIQNIDSGLDDVVTDTVETDPGNVAQADVSAELTNSTNIEADIQTTTFTDPNTNNSSFILSLKNILFVGIILFFIAFA